MRIIFRKKCLCATTIAATTALVLSGCGLQSNTAAIGEVGGGSIQRVENSGGRTVTVTAKNFTEQLVLGKILILTSKAAGYDVEDLTNVPGSQPERNLMRSGGATAAMEYTGTAWLTYMGHETGISDPGEQWQAVHDEDLKNCLTWGKPARMNNTYALAVRRDFGEKYGLKNLSDLSRIPVGERKLCVEAEFNSRSDGLNPMLEKYGLPRGSQEGVPEGNVSVMDTGSVYQATANGSPCNLGEVFTTDGRIKALDLTVLEDDRDFFPAYNGAPVVNSEFLKENPELMDRFEQVVAKLDNDTLRDLNLKVDVEGEDPAKVAKDWMVREGFIAG